MTRRTLYLLRRVVVYPEGDGEFEGPTLGDSIPGYDGGDRRAPVAVCTDRTAAEAEARRLDAAERDRLNPWWLRECQSRLVELPPAPGPDLAALGATIPDPDVIDSQYGIYETTTNQSRWYDEQSPGWPPELRAAVWRAVLGDRGFYDVTEIELDDGG